MILPPLVDVVRIQASSVKVFGPRSAFGSTALPVLPSKVVAVSVSPLIAPPAARVTPPLTVASSKPVQS